MLRSEELYYVNSFCCKVLPPTDSKQKEIKSENALLFHWDNQTPRITTQPVFSFSKSKTETLEKGLKYVQS